MTSKPVAALLAELNIDRSHSRPRVSSDNPCSESQFKTLKHCPAFPDRFGSIADAHAFCDQLFAYYNHTGTAGSGCTPRRRYTSAPPRNIRDERARPRRRLRGQPGPVPPPTYTTACSRCGVDQPATSDRTDIVSNPCLIQLDSFRHAEGKTVAP